MTVYTYVPDGGAEALASAATVTPVRQYIYPAARLWSGFESNSTPGWSPSNVTGAAETAQAQAGTYGLLVTATSGNVEHYDQYSGASIADGSLVYVSIDALPGSAHWLYFGDVGATNFNTAWADVSGGVFGAVRISAPTLAAKSIAALGSGWYRLTMLFTHVGAGGLLFRLEAVQVNGFPLSYTPSGTPESAYFDNVLVQVLPNAGVATGSAATTVFAKNYVAGGGAEAVAGAATTLFAKNYTPDGGSEALSGAATLAKSLSWIADGGGETLSGDAITVFAKNYVPGAGGEALSGAAIAVFAKNYVADAGSETVAGASIAVFAKNYAPDGGSETLSGAAALATAHNYVPRGATVLSDSFARADASALGNADTGQLWTAYSGTIGIRGNDAAVITPGTSDKTIAGADSGTADGVVSAVLSTLSAQQAYLPFRIQDGGNFLMAYTTSSTYRLYQTIGGAAATLLASVAQAPVAGDLVEVLLSGSAISLRVNGTVIASVTNTNFQTATVHGIGANDTTTRWGAFGVTLPTPGVAAGGAAVTAQQVLHHYDYPAPLFVTSFENASVSRWNLDDVTAAIETAHVSDGLYAVLLTATGGNVQHRMYTVGAGIADGATIRLTVDLRAVGTNWAYFGEEGGKNFNAVWLDLLHGVFGTPRIGPALLAYSSITPLSDGWYRVVLQFIRQATTLSAPLQLFFEPVPDNGAIIFTPNGTTPESIEIDNIDVRQLSLAGVAATGAAATVGPPQTVPITHTLTDAGGVPLADVQVTVKLSPDALYYTFHGTEIATVSVETHTDTLGVWTLQLARTDVLPGAKYRLREWLDGEKAAPRELWFVAPNGGGNVDDLLTTPP